MNIGGLRSNRAAHADARGAALYFIQRHWPRAGGRGRYAAGLSGLDMSYMV